MPVGNSDKGVGLWAGQVMLSLDNINQYIDWWHEALPNSQETFDHNGLMGSIIFSPSITVGLTNYWNLTATQSFGTRIMSWKGDSTTIHHRNETSVSGFRNAIGGYLGDAKLMLRYLVFNDGQGNGRRFFIGSGLIVPSKNTLTSDPFFLSGEEKDDHRHFSMSEGVFKALFELQYFKKNIKNPVFIGGSLSASMPLSKNGYGYEGSNELVVGFNVLFKEIIKARLSPAINLSLRYIGQAYWNDIEAPNSEALILKPGLSFSRVVGSGVLGVAVLKPLFIEGEFSGADIEGLDSKISAYQMTISFRMILDYTIPWLDPFRKL